ncbi:hypothetical protein [Methylocystis sp. Sn-Cys]|uniref:hypothetical protein n=1 Tax=Methylocystis sp. Sn-Cys TaxID=1701263 RepID=UPI001920F293|nr:hypothetical protein [Methylocystis sp. Sn-Cys]MBL1256042.1 hypothetical protein [Methylocystis sp. Sn-Cys]
MALAPIDETHALQIQAGTIGRKAGHAFEDEITLRINSMEYPLPTSRPNGAKHVIVGDPAMTLLNYIGSSLGFKVISRAVAISTGALATSEAGQKWLSINGANVRRCKSDIVITISDSHASQTVGISTKQCSKKTPTNAQLFFTTARGFVKLLRDNGIAVSDAALSGLREFCGDAGFRPLDNAEILATRIVDPRRFFWEEIDADARDEWEVTLARHQEKITRLLLQKAYIDDPFIPDFITHKTKLANDWHTSEVALYSIDELVKLSCKYQGFVRRPYRVNKGSYRDPQGVQHLAPRFGIVQMQRGGQAQHPEQLQFNLEAGYFYGLEKLSD